MSQEILNKRNISALTENAKSQASKLQMIEQDLAALQKAVMTLNQEVTLLRQQSLIGITDRGSGPTA